MIEQLARYKFSKELFKECREKIKKLPDREVERLNRLSNNYLNSIDSSHPPKLYRINLVKNRNVDSSLLFTEDVFINLNKELEIIKDEIQKRLIHRMELSSTIYDFI